MLIFSKTMAHISYPFKKTNKAVYNKPTSVLTKDNLYWKKLGLPVLIKEFGAIDYLDFSPVEPHYFAATCSVRVQIYDPIAKVVAKNISKFVEAAYGASFRGDGKLLVAGSEESVVKLFDVQSKNILRVFNGHTGPVHRTFFTKDQIKVLSYSDDKSVAQWDIATEQKIASFSEHTDYVRAGAPSPISPDLFLSGSYDSTVKLYDSRSNDVVLTTNHGSPVESTLFLPSGGIFISAGGTEIKVWDIFNGGKLLSCISQHHKTVTTLRLASNNSRLISASLDRHVKIYDVSTFKVVHNIDFPNAILSMAISKNDDTFAVGMVDGIISVRKRVDPAHPKEERRGLSKFAPDNTQTTIIGEEPNVENKKKSGRRGPAEEIDEYLRKMNFASALSEGLKSIVAEKYPEKTIALLQELLRRKVLYVAIDGLQDKDVGRLLKFFRKNLGETRFARVVIDAINIFFDVYNSQLTSLSESNLFQYKSLSKLIEDEIEVCQKVNELEGALNMLMAGSQIGNETMELHDTFAPSSNAQKEIVIDV